MPPAALTPSQITRSDFLAALRRYDALVPAALKPLDAQRYDAIPAALAARRSDASSPSAFSLTHAEVLDLVTWKLKHGTFRPTLLALVRGNPAELVQSTTAAAFALLDRGGGDDAAKALKTLVVLRGVGPATASLLLAVAEPAGTPFFSDEVFRWVHWGEGGEGWGRRIGYTEKEYGRLVERVRDVVGRVRGWDVGVPEAVAVEKVAWVLGREGVDCGGEGKGDGGAVVKGKKRGADGSSQGDVKRAKKDGSRDGEVVEEKLVVEKKEPVKKQKKAEARKAVSEEAPRRQTRSSTRKRT
ncbi:hypothetical protein GTA08_BOTSDO01049 [Neofusicoccum parvum]|uniref:Uncharacterized protein n=1 Tax=Neofusicoccum parvum TaxID=310453 RepID=A0ACB5S210_9PEZI|nr:hypothetical protein GTA08_BOTSDO01049 [Neofusicoccum parvum]